MKYKQYLVKWEIDVIAKSPEEAAELALEIQRDVESQALNFTVTQQSNKKEFDIYL